MLKQAYSIQEDLPVTLIEIPVYLHFCWMSVTIPYFNQSMYPPNPSHPVFYPAPK